MFLTMKEILSIRKVDDSELKDKLLDLIKDKKTNVEICEILNIDRNKLHDLLLDLRNHGMLLGRKYYSNGTIQYKPICNNTDQIKYGIDCPDKTIITGYKENQFKALVISDLHFGNENVRLDLINRAFNYCIKNDIHIILLGGDLIDGIYSKSIQVITNINKQIEYFINNYPYDKSILSIGIAGDHDLSALQKKSINIIEALNNYRHDIILGGFNKAKVNIKNDQILLYHCTNPELLKDDNIALMLGGHLHKYEINYIDNILNVLIPSLSNLNDSLPTALELDLNLNKGFINYATIKQICFEDKDILLNESTYNLLSNRNVPSEGARNEDTRVKSFTK